MGQRLVISVVEDQERIATIYFHWSGYTKSVYDELKTLINMLDGKNMNKNVSTEDGFSEVEPAKSEEKGTLLKLIRFYESIGGGLSADSYSAFEERYPGIEFKRDADRNNGLIDFAEKEMKEADMLAEAKATIDLDTREVFVDPFYFVNEDELESDDAVTELKDDPTQFAFDEIEDRYNMICSVNKTYVRFDTDAVYGIIE